METVVVAAAKRRVGNCRNCGPDVDFYVSNNACVTCQNERSKESYRKRKSGGGGCGGDELEQEDDEEDDDLERFSKSFGRAIKAAKTFPTSTRLALSASVNKILSDLADTRRLQPQPQPQPQPQLTTTTTALLSPPAPTASKKTARSKPAKASSPKKRKTTTTTTTDDPLLHDDEDEEEDAIEDDDDDDSEAVAEIERQMQRMQKAGLSCDHYKLCNASSYLSREGAEKRRLVLAFYKLVFPFYSSELRKPSQTRLYYDQAMGRIDWQLKRADKTSPDADDRHDPFGADDDDGAVENYYTGMQRYASTTYKKFLEAGGK
jgi:hypothetical protein